MDNISPSINALNTWAKNLEQQGKKGRLKLGYGSDGKSREIQYVENEKLTVGDRVKILFGLDRSRDLKLISDFIKSNEKVLFGLEEETKKLLSEKIKKYNSINVKHLYRIFSGIIEDSYLLKSPLKVNAVGTRIIFCKPEKEVKISRANRDDSKSIAESKEQYFVSKGEEVIEIEFDETLTETEQKLIAAIAEDNIQDIISLHGGIPRKISTLKHFS